MNMVDIIAAKKEKELLTDRQISFFIDGVINGSIPDYQISALLMAICLNGMNTQETFYLTRALANSGEKAVISSIKGNVVDKHSTGGVGDKCTIIVGPIVSALGVPFAKLSGRGLGYTGGTKDKLESIFGFRMDYTPNEIISLVNEIGIVISSQNKVLAPADKRLYEIRDVTATTDSIPLIAASIMSKKIASGAKKLILDVKCGDGAFMKNYRDALKLANLMLDIAIQADIHAMIYITDMNQPLGYAVGNALEINESYQTLSGNGPTDLREICIHLAAGILESARVAPYEQCIEMASISLKNGSALSKFRTMVVSQGGSLDKTGYPLIKDQAAFSLEILSEKEGYVSKVHAKEIGVASMLSGAGREKYEDSIDYSAGILLRKKIGDYVCKGEPIAKLYTNNQQRISLLNKMIQSALYISHEPVEKPPLILNVLRPNRSLFLKNGDKNI
jgi:pyrimidine-nucleoside phosphorylase